LEVTGELRGLPVHGGEINLHRKKKHFVTLSREEVELELTEELLAEGGVKSDQEINESVENHISQPQWLPKDFMVGTAC
jgi:hypothetical protein